MNSKQRRKNRRNLDRLVCPNCREPGRHYVSMGTMSGFWTCKMYYDTNGKRLPEHIDPQHLNMLDGMNILSSMFPPKRS